jgi:hypothetical protein
MNPLFKAFKRDRADRHDPGGLVWFLLLLAICQLTGQVPELSPRETYWIFAIGLAVVYLSLVWRRRNPGEVSRESSGGEGKQSERVLLWHADGRTKVTS